MHGVGGYANVGAEVGGRYIIKQSKEEENLIILKVQLQVNGVLSVSKCYM